MKVIPITLWLASWQGSQMLAGYNRRGLEMNSANDTIMKQWLVSNVGKEPECEVIFVNVEIC